MNKVIFSVLVMSVFVACEKKGCTDETAVNYTEFAKQDDGSCEYAEVISRGIEAPSTYKFERNGASTVSFSGQKERMDMLSEMVAYMKTANTPGTALDEAKMLNMYANENTPFIAAELNASSKQLKDKTASSDPLIIGEIENWIKEIASISDSTEVAKFEGKSGNSGVVQSGDKAYLVNKLGQEPTQIIEKGLVGAVFMHQISYVYLGAEKMNVDNDTIEEGQSYTKMEHHWDEAFGYLFGTVDFPAEGTDRFWGKYANGRNDLLASNTKLMNAFIAGRFAITQLDYAARDAQISIIRMELEKVCAATAMHYLSLAKKEISDDALRNHAISEAWAFLDNLKYAYEGKLTSAQIAEHKKTIGEDFYSISAANLTSVIDDLATTYGFESIKSQL